MKQILTLAITSLFAFYSFAGFDFTEADKAFALRSASPEGKAQLAKAKALYASVLSDKKSSQEDRLRAMTGAGKSAYFEGEMSTPDDDEHKETRRQIFGACADQADSIRDIKIPKKDAPTKTTQTAEHYYWRAVCLAYKAKASNAFAKLGIVSGLKSALADGISLDSNYEGGGIRRASAGVYINSAGRIFGLYKPDDALANINKALEKGPQFYNAYLIKADVLEALSKPEEAEATLRTAWAKLGPMTPEQMPADQKQETVIYKERIKKRLDKIDEENRAKKAKATEATKVAS